ncbi:hypothetical protein NP493_355g01011 [Ridgeia piscesae]|uniref:Uncharacterized protein n=1 Tax=Ridgeia piscesae TaxID=27915 RepID=A0AAD9L2X2_RIDPI|nr:hypothetical protein NP493_355g01011 [Ridgeia piscesae]
MLSMYDCEHVTPWVSHSLSRVCRNVVTSINHTPKRCSVLPEHRQVSVFKLESFCCKTCLSYTSIHPGFEHAQYAGKLEHLWAVRCHCNAHQATSVYVRS